MTDLDAPRTPQPQVPAVRADTATNDLVLPLVGWGTYVLGWGFVGLVIAYVDRGNAPPSVRDNYTYMIRTFWIGCLYLVLGLMIGGLCFALAGLANSGAIWASVVLWGLLPSLTAVWFLARCVKGIVLIVRRQDVAYPGTWWV